MAALAKSEASTLQNKEENSFVRELKATGLLKLDNVFSKETIARWNQLLDPILKERSSEEKSYVKIHELDELNILSEFFNPQMRGLLASFMPDPAILCFHVYETCPSEKPHVFGDTFSGWHRDVNHLPGLQADDPNYVSFFVYLSDVSEESGAFEIVPKSFTGPLKRETESVKVLGEKGTTFVWNRTMFHRATPNRSKQRRRVLKVSLQHNYLQNEHIEGPDFLSLRKKYNEVDPFLFYLVGGVHRYAPTGELPDAFHNSDYEYTPFASNSKVSIKFFHYLRSIFWYFRRAKKMFGP